MKTGLDIKDYLHLYLGCECMIGDLNWKREEFTHGLAPGVDLDYGKPIKSIISAHVLNAFPHKTTPILRPLLSITEEECVEAAKILGGAGHLSKDSLVYQVHELMANIRHGRNNISGYEWMCLTIYLLSKGFDIFGLIESGLAIEKINETKV